MPGKRMTPEDTEALLKRLPVGHLGLSKDGLPYVVPLHYIYENGKIYFHCKSWGRKLEYIQANPRVCFEASDFVSLILGPTACDYATEYMSVIVYGRARIIEDDAEKLRVLTGLAQKYATPVADRPLAEREVQRTRAVEITVEEMTGKARPRKL